MAAPASHTAQKIEIDPRDLKQFVVVIVAAMLVGVMYYKLPDKLRIEPGAVLLIIIVLAFAPALAAHILGIQFIPRRILRTITLSVLVIMTLALVTSLSLLVRELPKLSAHGDTLLVPAALLWLTNVLTASIWYWEIDGNGPHGRRLANHEATDFLFPQQVGGNRTGWAPGFVDYLFLAFGFATALSPADTAPLTHRAKLMMMAEALISLTVLVLVIARSVNIF